MPFVKFLRDVVVEDNKRGTPNETAFTAGKTYDLPIASCQRWIKRGAATSVNAEEHSRLMAKKDSHPASVPKPVSVPKVETTKPVEPKVEPAATKIVVDEPKKVEPLKAPEAPKVVEQHHKLQEPATSDKTIPHDWKTLSWPKLKMLAQKFSSDPITNRVQADEIIEAELGKRK